MAQHASSDVALAAVGVGQHAVGVLGDGVDGQVSSGQVFFERDVWRGMHGKAVVALRGLAFGASQGVFFTRLRVQKHRKILAHRQVALSRQSLGRGTDHNPVVVAHRQA